MSDKKNLDSVKKIMELIDNGSVKMRPKWYFWFGSVAMIAGFVCLVVASIFLMNLFIFSIRTHGPMGAIRWQQLLASFPWWAPILAVIGIALGGWLLRRYDFSYKNNFIVIIIGLALTIFLAGFLINYFKLDNIYFKKGLMCGLYNRYDGQATSSCRQCFGAGQREPACFKK